MFPTVKSIAAVATLAVAGGLLFTTQESDDPTSVGAAVSASPSAGSDPMRTAWVTGTIPWSGRLVGSPETNVDGGVTRSYGYHWEDQGPLRLSDPRLVGTMSVTYNQDTHALAEEEGCSSVTTEGGALVPPCQFTVHSGTTRIVNDEGSWEGTTLALARGGRNAGGTVSDAIILTGSGAYEGLTAYLVFDLSRDPATVVGVIFPGGMPPIAKFE
jgi:hypothetical protein